MFHICIWTFPQILWVPRFRKKQNLLEGNDVRNLHPKQSRRRAAWRLHQQHLRENRQALDCLLENSPPDCLPENSLPVVLENPAAPEPNELCKDATESVVVRPNIFLFTEAADKVVGSSNNSESSVTNCESDTSVLDSDDESVDSAAPPLKAAPEWCVECGNAEGKLYTCTKCKAVKYCGVKCQMENWTQHKISCAFLKSVIGKYP